jgi:hypothetical protein
MKLLRAEPAMVASVLAGSLTLGAVFGLPLTVVQIGAVSVFLHLAAGLFVRSQVAPIAKV